MKKKLFFMPFLAAALFSCSEKGLVTGGDDVTDGESEISYLSVNIVSSQETGTRAENFKVGSEEENKVNSIRFYFFDENGEAAEVKSNGATYYDVSADEIKQSGESEGGNIESTVSAVIVIESPKNDGKPYYVAAVVNPTTNAPILEKGDDVSELQKAVADFSTTNGFVMSSSVYKAKKVSYNKDKKEESDSEDMEYIMVPVFENIQPTRLEALENKATIYVERVLAKVSVSLSIPITDDTDGLYDLNTKIDKGANSDNNAIYAKFLGWNVTATRKTSRLVKKIDIAWPSPFDAGWGSLSWNDVDNRRSYWAINPPVTNLETDYQYGNFGEGMALGTSTKVDKTPFSANKISFTENNYTYLQENAGSGTSEKASTANDELSKIIVAAQLVDKTGKSLELVEWGGDVYTKSDALTALARATQVYTVTTENGGDKYTPLTGEAIELVHKTVSDADKASEATSPRYYVSIALKEQSSDTKYAVYTYKDGSYTYEKITEENKSVLEDALASVGKIKYWNSGYTYYWVDIKHLGGDVTVDSAEEKKDGIAKYGVVRNHWYDYTFTSVKGLGVPVPDPGEIIYPETPNDEDLFYLAAEIKILSWRMVQHNEGLGWD